MLWTAPLFFVAASLLYRSRLLLPFRGPTPHVERIFELDQPRYLSSFLGNSGTVAPLPNGRFCVSDTSGGRVLLVGADCAVLASSTLQLDAPGAIALARDRQSIFVADAGGHAVHRLALPGLQRIGSSFDGAGMRPGSPTPSARLNYPAGLAVSASTGRVFVSDKGNHRILCLEESLDTIVFEYGACGKAGTGNGMLNLPGGICILEPQRGPLFGSGSSSGEEGGPGREQGGSEPGAQGVWEEEVVVADTSNNRLVVLSATSARLLRTLGGDAADPPPGMSEAEFLAWRDSKPSRGPTLRLTEPAGLCATAAGRLVVAERGSGVWHLLDRHGSPTRAPFSPYPALAQKHAAEAEAEVAGRSGAKAQGPSYGAGGEGVVEWALGIAGGAGGGYGSAGRVYLVEDCGKRIRLARTVRLV
jgi:hypothetical protein